MNNIILVSSTLEATEKYLAEYGRFEHIAKNAFNHVFPDKNGYTIDQIRNIISLASHQFDQPTVFVLWGFDTAKDVAQNAFLKTLEEHGEQIIFILVTSNSSLIAPTILSRSLCVFTTVQQTALTKVDEEKIADFIKKVQKKGVLASTLVQFNPQKKREEIPLFLTQFINYGYFALGKKIVPKLWLAEKLKKTMEALPLITRNFVDSEAVLDNIFLS